MSKTAEQIARKKASIIAEEKKIAAEEALDKASDALKAAMDNYKANSNQGLLGVVRNAGGDLAVAKVALDLAKAEFEATRIRRPRKVGAVDSASVSQ